MVKSLTAGRERDSSLELYRIVGMFAIVVSHVVLSLLPNQVSFGGGYLTGLLEGKSYCLDFRIASADPAMWALVLLKMLGQWGNAVFTICAAWFLCRGRQAKLGKVVKMVLEVLAISLVMLALMVALGVHPSAKDVLKSFFPNIFANNWFITCYLMLYAIHPAINLALEKAGKRGHAAAMVVLCLLYMILPLAKADLLWWNRFFVMVTTYVLVAYCRYYLADALRGFKAGWGAFIVGTFATAASVALLELAGLHVGALADKMLHFAHDGNPFVFLSAFGLFNIMRARPFVNARLNRVAGLMLLVYLIHENLIFKRYMRPCAWALIHDNLGYDLLFVWLGLFALGLFVVALLCAWIYTKTLGKAVNPVAQRIEGVVRRVWGVAAERICAIR